MTNDDTIARIRFNVRFLVSDNNLLKGRKIILTVAIELKHFYKGYFKPQTITINLMLTQNILVGLLLPLFVFVSMIFFTPYVKNCQTNKARIYIIQCVGFQHVNFEFVDMLFCFIT